MRFKEEAVLTQKDFQNLSLSEKEKIILYFEVLRELAYSYIKKDLYEANIRQDEVFYKLFMILASQIGNLVNSSELATTLGISKTAVDNYLYVMQKSFHVHLVPPFFKNLRKELTKMPKVYFFDSGLRNFFVKNFRAYPGREDKGPLLENALFRQLIEKYDLEEIRFWRTTQKQEIDFVVGEQVAFEVKAQPSKFKKSASKTFLKNYPQIRFFLASFDNQERRADSPPILEIYQV